MRSIGILLPGSTLYPSIGIDFLQGIKSCFTFHQFSDIDIHVALIGYGIKEDDIHREAEKFLLIHNVDAVIAFAGDHLANRLEPLFAAAGKLLLIANAGANYPQLSTAGSHTVFHSLNDCICTFLTGKLCAKESASKKAIMATSFYDGGYNHAHAMANAFIMEGGEIDFNFVSPLKKEDFNIGALEAFIKQHDPEVCNLISIFSGDMARVFYEKIAPLQEAYNLHLYGSPMMFDSTAGDFPDAKPYVHQIKGFTGWLYELDNEINNAFKRYYQNKNGKEANIFSMQGWETALILMAYLKQRESVSSTLAAIEKLKELTLNSARGALRINEHNLVTGPAYLVSAGNHLELTIEDTIEDISGAWKEMTFPKPDTGYSTWRNTYLCI